MRKLNKGGKEALGVWVISVPLESCSGVEALKPVCSMDMFVLL